MPTPSDPGEPGLVDLLVEVAIERGQTKTVRRVKKNGTIKFNNVLNDVSLTISSPSTRPPFVLPDCATAASEFTVQARDHLTVTISDAYDVGERFSYTAELEGSMPEDPIVIIERR